jgi:hypothetical protein
VPSGEEFHLSQLTFNRILGFPYSPAAMNHAGYRSGCSGSMRAFIPSVLLLFQVSGEELFSQQQILPARCKAISDSNDADRFLLK